MTDIPQEPQQGAQSTWLLLRISGIVQGVGFRPTAYRVAMREGLCGWVKNTVGGVEIVLRSTLEGAQRYLDSLRAELPVIARIDSVIVEATPTPEPEPYTFGIRFSTDDDDPARVTDIGPDVAICQECLEDIERMPRRLNYFLTNCTNCGPRFSIVEALPYDRRNTSMSVFEMCHCCHREYTDPLDRRFHAQPIACSHCGPEYTLTTTEGETVTDATDILRRSALHLANHGILMVKGIGGYNLLALAQNSPAISTLRSMKRRPRKPFAVMVGTLKVAKKLASLTSLESDALTSWRAPIVVAQQVAGSGIDLAPNVAPGCTSIGVMLPYMGFQHLLMRELANLVPDAAVALTSANHHGRPMITDDSEGLQYAKSHNIPIVTYNRRIVNRVDDSLVRSAGNSIQVLRRARGYAPEPLHTPHTCQGIVAMGADVSSAWAFGRHNDIILSQYVGSLLDVDTATHMRKSMCQTLDTYRIKPCAIVIDAHPRYQSSAMGRAMGADLSIPVIEMWHHHAHAVSVMAEYGINEEVLALVLDGTGAGPDHTIWGSELLRCTPTAFERLDHGEYLPLPGGDMASRQPWRMAVSLLHSVDGNTARLPEHLIRHVGATKISILTEMLQRRINTPLSCGAGRLFDAISALLGLAYDNGYESEAPILLENAATLSNEASEYPFDHQDPLKLKPLLEGVLNDLSTNTPISRIAANFHATYAAMWCHRIEQAAADTGLTTVVLSGGVLQNGLLAQSIVRRLTSSGLHPLLPLKTPCNDTGIASGQIYHAALTLPQTIIN